ncbi:MAG: MFS transporter [Planctomycetes bacterium]|nr:MFS transporter [Planctomycetota bacterium]
MPSSRAAAALRRVVQIEEGEGRPLFWACAFHFLLLTSYFILRPLRDVKGLETRGLNSLFFFTLLGTLVTNPIFATFVARFPRRVFIPVTFQFFVTNLLVFALLFWKLGANVAAASAFFVWVTVYNLFVVSVFWGFMSDLFRTDQAKRLYGLIGIWGTLGAILGPSLSKWLVERIDFHGLVVLSAVLLQASILCIGRLVPFLPSTPTPRILKPKISAANLLDGVRRTLRSSFLTSICGYVLLFTVSSTLIYFQKMGVAESAFHDKKSQTDFLASIDQKSQILTLIVQCFLTGRIIRWVGVGGALAVLPVITIIGGTGLWLVPIATVLVVLEVTRRAADIGTAKPAREALFTVVDRQDKYVAKNFMDTFVYRLGDLAGLGLDLLGKALKFGMGEVALLLLPLSIAWFGLGLLLGRQQATRAKAPPVD